MLAEHVASHDEVDTAAAAAKLPFGHIRWILPLLAVAGFAAVDRNFRSYGNLEGFIQSTGVLIVLAMGQSFVLLIGGVDLSVGAVVALGSVVLASLLTLGVPLPLAVALTVLTGFAVGLSNGAAVHLLRIPSFIGTFGVMGVASAAGLMLSGGNRIGLPPGSPLRELAEGGIAGLPYQTMLALGLLAGGTFFLRNIPVGRHLYALGGNPGAARLSGLNVGRLTLFAFALSGLYSGFASVLYTSRIISGNPIGGTGLNLESIAAAVIGGVSLFGGSGTLLGACLGAILYSLIGNALTISNVNPNITEIVGGIIVIIAGLINVITDKRS
jgi:ribose transport system permease protein